MLTRFLFYNFLKFTLFPYNGFTLLCSFLPNSRVVQLYMCVLLLVFFSISIYHGVLNTAPCPVYRGTFPVHPVCNSLLLRIPDSQAILPAAPHLGNQSLTSASVTLFHRKGPPCRALDSTLCDVTRCLSVSLYSVWSSPGPPRSLRMAWFHSFSRLTSAPSCARTVPSSSILL